MNAKWLISNIAVVICLASIALTALAQEGPADQPVETAGDQLGAPGVPGEFDDLEDLDGFGELLAAQAPGGRGGAGGRGPHARMDRGMRGGPGMGPGGHGAEELHRKLNLSDDQKAKLADIHDRQARAAVPIRAEQRIASLDMRKLIRADKPDQRAIDAQIDRVASLRAALQKSHVAGMLEARAVLTPAQQKLIRGHHGAIMGRHMRGGPGMHGGPGMRMKHL